MLVINENIFVIDAGREGLQVAVYRRISVGVLNVQRMAVPPGRNADAGDHPGFGGEHIFAFHSLGFQVDAGMEVISAQLGKVSREIEGDVQRGGKRCGGKSFRLRF